MKRFLNLKWASILLAALVLIVLTTARVLDATASVEPPPDVDQIRQRTGIPVEILQIREAPLEVRRTFTGTVRGIRSATVRARTGDEILAIPVRVGQAVEAGAIVVRQSGQGSAASVEQAEAAFEQARRTVERLRSLHERGAISEQEWDDAGTGMEVARANLEAARKAVVLTSPIRGTVTDVLVTQGTFPSAGDPLVRISDLSSLQVLLQVSPEQRREMSLGQTAYLVDAGAGLQTVGQENATEGGTPPTGRITRIALQADPESRLVEAEITFPGSASVLAGSLTAVEVVTMEKPSAIAVPARAVADGRVWVVDEDGRAHHAEVRVGARTRDQIEILSGLTPGQQLVVSGGTLLTEGAMTRVVGG